MKEKRQKERKKERKKEKRFGRFFQKTPLFSLSKSQWWDSNPDLRIISQRFDLCAKNEKANTLRLKCVFYIEA
jgi:hypothetical protein